MPRLSTGGGPRQGPQNPTNTTNNSNAEPSSSAPSSSTSSPPNLIMHGINITHLRKLTQSCFGNNDTASSPSMAVFLASTIYAKTKQWSDAFLYAQALVRNGQHKRAVQWIHQAGLLHCYSSYKNNRSAHQGESSLAALQSLQLESVLLAAASSAVLKDWNAILGLLEETHYYTSVVETLSSFPSTAPLDDDDDIAWQQLAQSISKIVASTKVASTKIHPLARICSLRGRAYSELGHPLRAANFWKKALYIDALCIDALEGLLDKSVVEPSNTLETVLSLDFTVQHDGSDTPSNDDANCLEWLRALYLARVHVAAPTGGLVQEGTSAAAALATSMSMDHAVAHNPQEDDHHDEENEPMDSNAAVLAPPLSAQQQQQNAARNRQSAGSFANAMSGSDPFWHDSSSMQLLTPIPQQPSMADMSAASSGLFFGNASAIPGRTSLGGTLPEHRPIEDRGPQDGPGGMFRSTVSPASTEAESALNVLWNKHQLQHSPEVLAMAAQQAFSKYDWKNALRYSQELRKIDPLSQNSNKAAFCHVSTLVQLRQKRSLFRLAHEWVEAAPKDARSWFAVGAYYYACQRYHVAQRHFCRATRLDPQCAEAWIAFGTSFAACDESDQALASFRAAQRLAPGNHVSLLYIGMEYLRTNHLVLASHFLSAANDSCNGTDALAKSELGVLNMYQKKYNQAIGWFLQALGCSVERLRESMLVNPESMLDLDALGLLVEGVQDEYWEPTLFNLAHAYRKERQFEHAVVCLERCLALKESSSVYSALAFCLHLHAMSMPISQNSESSVLLHQAIDTYHQALAKKPDAAFSSEMLYKALGDALEQTDFFASNQENDAAGDNASDLRGMSAASSSKVPTDGRPSRSSMWTDDGLSLSVESASDIDMS
jgi:anaphase-promoting complex subunit 6